MFKKTTLKNGLRIITVPMKNTQAVTVLVLVGTGSKYETKEINGISHFAEHMFFKGTKKRPNQLKISEALDEVGGMYNAFTSKEHTGYFAKVDFKHLDLALDWVSDILINSKFDEREIEKEKGVIIEEINMYLDMPMAHIGDLWEKLLYGDQPAGWSLAGEKEIVAGLKREQFLTYLNRHYTASNTVVCVAGNIEADSVSEKIKRYFKKIKTADAERKLKVVERQDAPKNLIQFKKTDQTHLCLGVRGYDIFHPKKYAQEVLAVILGGNMSSRLFISVRGRGLAYYIRTGSDNMTDSGYLVTQAGVDHRNAEKAINLILKEYKSLKDRKITQKELQKAKDYLKGNFILSLESSSSQANFYSDQELLTGKILTPEEEREMIDKVSVFDIQKVARDIFKPEGLNLALIGPVEDKEKFSKILKI